MTTRDAIVQLTAIFVIPAGNCSSSPCQNNGTCNVDELGGFSCNCLQGISGTQCESIKSYFYLNILDTFDQNVAMTLETMPVGNPPPIQRRK